MASNLTLGSVISAFGASAKAKLSNPSATGQPEDQLRSPLEQLFGDLAELASIPRKQIVAVGETSLSDLKTRPDYGAYLAWQLADGPAGRSGAYASMSRGWALGSAGFKRALLLDHAVSEETRAWERGGAREVREERWQIRLEKLRTEVPAKSRADHRKAAPWKVGIALAMKRTTDADNRWLAQQLKIGSPRYLANLVSAANKK